MAPVNGAGGCYCIDMPFRRRRKPPVPECAEPDCGQPPGSEIHLHLGPDSSALDPVEPEQPEQPDELDIQDLQERLDETASIGLAYYGQLREARTALQVIAARSCERFTTGPGSCLRNDRVLPSEDSGGTVYEQCYPCVAWEALHGDE